MHLGVSGKPDWQHPQDGDFREDTEQAGPGIFLEPGLLTLCPSAKAVVVAMAAVHP